jgi:hypothetical protein
MGNAIILYLWNDSHWPNDGWIQSSLLNHRLYLWLQPNLRTTSDSPFPHCIYSRKLHRYRCTEQIWPQDHCKTTLNLILPLDPARWRHEFDRCLAQTNRDSNWLIRVSDYRIPHRCFRISFLHKFVKQIGDDLVWRQGGKH